MSTSRSRWYIANICMGQIRNYFSDLVAYYDGDEGRWSRMVVDSGKSLATASPQGWATHIDNLAPEVVDFHRDELRRIFDQLTAWGLTVDYSVFENSD